MTAVPRGVTTQAYLKMDWSYPVYKTAEPTRTSGTAPVALKQALSREEALRFIAGNDTRPLLVLRECPVCNKTDDALLKGGSENDRTLVLARWFNCVKLPLDVVEPNHPFNALFPNNESEHLFLALADGTSKVPLESDGSRTELWAGMSRILDLAYEKNPANSYADVLKRFDQIDILDSKILEQEARKGVEMESSRPDRKKVDEIDRAIAGFRSQIEAEKAVIQRMIVVPPRAPIGDKASAPAKAVR